ncbi:MULTISPECIES: VanZ family protein [unclassified Streptomyces]|uniref:VanZ family protein n=1 Tax=unclassified Streptomyces TaxID=2593676 RepID=UPI0039B6F6B0
MTVHREGATAGSVVAEVSWGRTALRVLIMVLGFVALVGFSAVLAKLTLTPSPASSEIAGSNLRPGNSLRQYAEDYTFLAACKQVGGNLVLGAPFGLILPVLVPRKMRMVRVVVLTALVMVLVEMAQGAIVEGRAFDVDDVILNTSGALIAYLLVGRKIGRRFHALARPGQRDQERAEQAEERRLERNRERERKRKAARAKARTRPGAEWRAVRTRVADRVRRSRRRAPQRP